MRYNLFENNSTHNFHTRTRGKCQPTPVFRRRVGIVKLIPLACDETQIMPQNHRFVEEITAHKQTGSTPFVKSFETITKKGQMTIMSALFCNHNDVKTVRSYHGNYIY